MHLNTCILRDMRILLFSLLLSLAYIAYERITSAHIVVVESSVQDHIDPYEGHAMHCKCPAHR